FLSKQAGIDHDKIKLRSPRDVFRVRNRLRLEKPPCAEPFKDLRQDGHAHPICVQQKDGGAFEIKSDAVDFGVEHGSEEIEVSLLRLRRWPACGSPARKPVGRCANGTAGRGDGSKCSTPRKA